MADVFGDPMLFGEFEKDRSYADDHSKRCVGEARAFLSTLCSPLKHSSLTTGNGLKVSGDARADTGSSTVDGNNPRDIASGTEYIQKLESEIQQLKEINDKLLLERKLISPKSLEMAADGPAVQILFMNNAVARDRGKTIKTSFRDLNLLQCERLSKYRSKVENCLKEIFSHDEEEYFRESKIPGNTSEVVGSYQYFRDFVLDVSGWPLPSHMSSAMVDSASLPKYEQVFRQPLPCERSKDKDTPPEVIIKEKRPKAACFNCGGDHNVSACMEKRDHQKINLARRQFMDKFSPSGSNPGKQRYHIEDDPRFSEMRPGTVSDVLRDALGISTQQLPPYIYQMRVLGYPPGHLENAKQSTSGLTMFDKHGQELTSDGELLEDGEVNEAFVQSPEYNLDKLVDYPGFNVDLPAGTIDESQHLGMPPMQPQWSKNVMKDFLFTKQKMTDSAKRKLDDLSYRDGSRKCVRRTDVELETTTTSVDMEIEETTTGDTIPDQFLPSPWPIVSMPTGIIHAPPPPPPLPEDPEETLPPLPLDPSPGGSSAFEFCVESLEESGATSEPQSEVETSAAVACMDSSSNLSAANSDNNDPNKQPDSTAASLQFATKIITTPIGGRFGGSRSFCLGTPLALPITDSPTAKGLPDSSKFASGVVSDLVLHENLPNATGTFNKLKVVLTDAKNRSSSSTNAPLKR